MDKKGIALIFDASVIQKYIEGKDSQLEKILDKVETMPKEKAVMETTVQSLLYAIKNAESVDGEKLQRFLKRVGVMFVDAKEKKAVRVS